MLRFSYSLAHLERELRPRHGPQVWPAWKLLSVSVIRLDIAQPSTGWRTWVYSRWGAVYFDIVFDRRRATAS